MVVVDAPYLRNNPGCDPMVILTNAPVNKPLSAYDRYDRRSEMENAVPSTNPAEGNDQGCR